MIVVEFGSKKEAESVVNAQPDSSVLIDDVKLYVDMFSDEADTFGRHYNPSRLKSYRPDDERKWCLLLFSSKAWSTHAVNCIANLNNLVYFIR